MTPGLDVSKYQGAINWPRVAASGKRFTFVRYGDGLYVDPTFTANAKTALEVIPYVGGYLFFRLGVDPIRQAEALITASSGACTLPCAIDIETLNGQPSAELHAAFTACVYAVRKGLGRYPILYTSPGWWDALPPSDLDGSLPLWVADWTLAGAPRLPRGWEKIGWLFWQKTDREKTPGIDVPDDGDVFNGDEDMLRIYSASMASTLPPPPSPPTTTPTCESWVLLHSPIPAGVSPRATTLLGEWRKAYDDATAQAANARGLTSDLNVHLDEPPPDGAPGLLRYVFCWHPPDGENHAPHSGVTVFQCSAFSSAADADDTLEVVG